MVKIVNFMVYVSYHNFKKLEKKNLKNFLKEREKELPSPNKMLCLFKSQYRSIKELSMRPGNEVISVDFKREKSL